MFRISFDPKRGKFIVQVLKLGLIWVTVRDFVLDREGPHDHFADALFNTYDAARSYVSSIGLDQLYQDRSENVRQQYLRAA